MPLPLALSVTLTWGQSVLGVDRVVVALSRGLVRIRIDVTMSIMGVILILGFHRRVLVLV